MSNSVIKKYYVFSKKLLTTIKKNDIINKHSDEIHLKCIDNIAEWSSPVARRAHNPKVGGSNPPSATNIKKFSNQYSF